MIAVIPSCRNVDLARLAPLIDHGVRFIVVDDSEGSIRIDHPQFEVHNWGDRRKRLGRKEICIPKGNGACRDFGFYLAWKEGAPGETIVALDDDCAIEAPDFPLRVESCLGRGARPVARGQGDFFNTFDLYRGIDSQGTFPRGFPYSARIGYEPWRFEEETVGEVGFNLGLWTDALDINAIDKYALPRTVFPDAALKSDNVVLPPRVLTSVCSGNMHFRRELIPAAYQLPMNVDIMSSWSIDRYGDIWGGFILKTLMDVRGDRMSVGGPLVNHGREAPFHANVPREHLAHLVNDEFIALLRGMGARLAPGSYLDMMHQVREEFGRPAAGVGPILKRYLAHLGDCLAAWLDVLK